jgi:uncharacterized protein YjdB
MGLRIKLLGIFTLLIALVACPTPPVTISTIQVTPVNSTIEQGQTQQFTAVAVGSNGIIMNPQPTFTWSSNNTNANVSNSGLATGLAVGSSNISASANGVTGSAALTITANTSTIVSITVAPSSASIVVGATQQFTAVARNSSGNAVTPQPTFTWSSNNANASVSNTGLASALAVGSSNISASANGVTGSAVLTISETPSGVINVTVLPNTANIAIGATQQFTATISNLVNQSVSWKSDNESVATVSQTGLVTAITAGTASITATSIVEPSKNSSAMITVRDSILVTPTAVKLAVNQTQIFTASVLGLNNTNVTWSVTPTTSTTLVTGATNSTISFSSSKPGNYVLTATSLENPSKMATANITVEAEAGVQYFDIAIGDTISNGVPSVGAGNIESSGASDVYTFTGSAGQQIIIQKSNVTGSIDTMGFKLVENLTSAVLFNAANWGFSSSGVITLRQGGTYTLTVGCNGCLEVGTYQLKLWNVPLPQNFNVAIGDTISNGVPSSGAGNIESFGASDVYTFTGTAGQQIIIQKSNVTGSIAAMGFKLVEDSTSAVLFNDVSNWFTSTGIITLRQGGTYTLTVGCNGCLEVGTYQLKLWNVPLPQNFNVAIGDTISNGVPGVGAGNIESFGASDVYTFTGTAGQQIIIQKSNVTGSIAAMGFKLVEDSTNAVLFNDVSNWFTSTGIITLRQGGTYTLTVSCNGCLEVGTYQLKLWNVPLPQNFNVAIGDTISNGVPSFGAGNIESFGASDVYKFTGTAGQQIIIQKSNVTGSIAGMGFKLVEDSTSAVLFNDVSNWFTSTGIITLRQGGTYTLTVGCNGCLEVGTYQLKLESN